MGCCDEDYDEDCDKDSEKHTPPQKSPQNNKTFDVNSVRRGQANSFFSSSSSYVLLLTPYSSP